MVSIDCASMYSRYGISLLSYLLLLSKTKIGDMTVLASDFLVQGNR